MLYKGAHIFQILWGILRFPFGDWQDALGRRGDSAIKKINKIKTLLNYNLLPLPAKHSWIRFLTVILIITFTLINTLVQ